MNCTCNIVWNSILPPPPCPAHGQAQTVHVGVVPCPNCGHCPTCGHTPQRGAPVGPPYQWQSATVTTKQTDTRPIYNSTPFDSASVSSTYTTMIGATS